jgi:mRNA interferase RelE/StbE
LSERYEIVFTNDARKDLDRLPAHVQRRILHWADLLAENPRRTGTRQLEGHPGLRRVHASKDYVILYTIEDARLTILIVSACHRRDVYRGL